MTASPSANTCPNLKTDFSKIRIHKTVSAAIGWTAASTSQTLHVTWTVCGWITNNYITLLEANHALREWFHWLSLKGEFCKIKYMILSLNWLLNQYICLFYIESICNTNKVLIPLHMFTNRNMYVFKNCSQVYDIWPQGCCILIGWRRKKYRSNRTTTTVPNTGTVLSTLDTLSIL